MPNKAEKKLKAVVKSHYSREIRKDVDLSDLRSLKLEKAWPLIRSEIEREIGSSNCSDLLCVPFVEEASLYRVCSVFVEQNGFLKPAGSLADHIHEYRSEDEYVRWLKTATFEDERFAFPHESVKITLQDEQAKNKVRVIMLNFSRLKFPQDRSPVNKIFLKNQPEFDGVTSMYMITDVVMAKTVEFRATTGISSRIFHLGNPTPLLFAIEKFDINNSGQLISQAPVTKQLEKVWHKVAPYDHLYTAQFNNATVVA